MGLSKQKMTLVHFFALVTISRTFQSASVVEQNPPPISQGAQRFLDYFFPVCKCQEEEEYQRGLAEGKNFCIEYLPEFYMSYEEGSFNKGYRNGLEEGKELCSKNFDNELTENDFDIKFDEWELQNIYYEEYEDDDLFDIYFEEDTDVTDTSEEECDCKKALKDEHYISYRKGFSAGFEMGRNSEPFP